MASERSRVEEEKEDPHAGSREGVKGDLLYCIVLYHTDMWLSLI